MTSHIVAFYVLAYGITWLFSALATPGFPPIVVPSVVSGLGGALSHWGPALAALLVAGATGGRVALARLLRPLALWRVGVRW